MPNHYDIDIWCEKCGKYLATIYPGAPIPETTDRICKKCQEKETILQEVPYA